MDIKWVRNYLGKRLREKEGEIQQESRTATCSFGVRQMVRFKGRLDGSKVEEGKIYGVESGCDSFAGSLDRRGRKKKCNKSRDGNERRNRELRSRRLSFDLSASY